MNNDMLPQISSNPILMVSGQLPPSHQENRYNDKNYGSTSHVMKQGGASHLVETGDLQMVPPSFDFNNTVIQDHFDSDSFTVD